MTTFMLIRVLLEGLADIMFNRFIDHSKEKRPPDRKLYLDHDCHVVLPSENIISMLTAKHTTSAIKWCLGRDAGDYIQEVASSLSIQPPLIPFKRQGNTIKFTKFGGDDFYIWEMGGVTKQGTQVIKQEVQPRPVLRRPWSLEFEMTVVPSQRITAANLETWLREGGMHIGLGAFRPRFGRFEVKMFEVE